MLDLADLRVFTQIADAGSISGAARLLGMPKSSVSRSLVRLESVVGSVLVERSTRHLRLTDAGLALQRYARRILNEVMEAEDAISGLSAEPRGDLRITAPFAFAVAPLAAMMPEFIARHPLVRVAINIDNRVVDLIGEEYDVAIRVGTLEDSTLIARKLLDIQMWLCASPAYLSRSPPIRKIADLANHVLLSYGGGASTWQFRNVGGVLTGVDLGVRVAVQEPQAILAMVRGGAGVALMPDFVLSDDVVEGRVRRLLPKLDFGSVPAYALYGSHRSLSPKVRAFVDALVRHFSTVSPSGEPPLRTTL